MARRKCIKNKYKIKCMARRIMVMLDTKERLSCEYFKYLIQIITRTNIMINMLSIRSVG